MHTALIEATQRGTVAVDTAAKYSVMKEKLERQMTEPHAQAATLVAINKDPRAEIGKIGRFLRRSRSQGEQVQSPAGHAASDTFKIES